MDNRCEKARACVAGNEKSEYSRTGDWILPIRIVTVCPATCTATKFGWHPQRLLRHAIVGGLGTWRGLAVVRVHGVALADIIDTQLRKLSTRRQQFEHCLHERHPCSQHRICPTPRGESTGIYKKTYLPGMATQLLYPQPTHSRPTGGHIGIRLTQSTRNPELYLD